MNSLLKLGCIALMTLSAFVSRSAPTVTKIAAGDAHSLFVESDGSLWGMGDNEYGQLGLGSGLSQTNRPQQILPSNSNVTNVSAGLLDSLFIKSDGSLWAMGYNIFGELGDSTTTTCFFPEQIMPSGSGVTTIACGYYHDLFRTSVTTGNFPNTSTNVSRWGIGYDFDGELGDGTTVDELSPEQIQSTTIASNGVTQLAAGFEHSLFVRADGSLWATGFNSEGQLGDGTMTERHSPVEIQSNNVIAVAAGYYHSLFLKSDSTLWAMGWNASGQLGDGTTVDKSSPVQVATNVTAVAASDDFSLFIKSDGSLWGMGDDADGELGNNSTTDQPTPVEIVPNNVVAIAAGHFHSLFIKSDGTLWAMGYNGFGQLGDGTTTQRNTPVQVVVPVILPRPVVTSISLSKTNLVVNGSNGQSGLTYFTLMSTNITKALNQWTPVATNVLNADGNFSFTATNAVKTATPQRFYILQAQ
jgi:alpha-tubulin suppressor-like RCC1 family protein